MKPAQINFVKECLPAAVSAGAAFNLNPLVILAQAAFESGWGTSNLAKECRNYFGLTAYGCSNWKSGCQYRQPFSQDGLCSCLYALT